MPSYVPLVGVGEGWGRALGLYRAECHLSTRKVIYVVELPLLVILSIKHVLHYTSTFASKVMVIGPQLNLNTTSVNLGSHPAVTRGSECGRLYLNGNVMDNVRRCSRE